MGILMNLIKKARKNDSFTKAYEEFVAEHNKFDLFEDGIIIFANDSGEYTISIDSSEIFPTKEKLYEYYLNLYKSFDASFKIYVPIEDLIKHKCTTDGTNVTLHTTPSGYGVYGLLNFTGTIIDCRDWFLETLINIYKICFKE